jgi:hypothetical protein
VQLAAGIALWTGERMRLLDNDVRDNGRDAGQGTTPKNSVAGVVVLMPDSGLTISRNRILNNFSRPPSAAPHVSGGVVIRNSTGTDARRPACVIADNEVVAVQGPALAVSAGTNAEVTITSNRLSGEHVDSAVNVSAREAVVHFSGNRVQSVVTDTKQLAVVIQGGHVAFNDNHCERLVQATEAHVLIEVSKSATASGNHCLEKATGPVASLRLAGPTLPGPSLAATANVTTSGVVLQPPGPTVANIQGIII